MSSIDAEILMTCKNPEEIKNILFFLSKKKIIEISESLKESHSIVFPINKKDKKEIMISTMVDYIIQSHFPFKNN